VTVCIDGRSLTVEDVVRVARHGEPVEIAREAYPRMQAGRAVIEDCLRRGDPVYGVNTGFGRLSDVRIADEDVERLQRNLVTSCCTGVGEPFPAEVVRAMLLLRANSLVAGLSGVRPVVVETLVAMLNRGVLPIVPSKGSVGASGDLAPLAHIALVLVGEGRATLTDPAETSGRTMYGKEALEAAGIEPVRLAAKEGLSLCNGTQAMAALGSLAVYDAARLADTADVVGALSAEALEAAPDAFDERLHAARPHAGQITTAANLRKLLADSAAVHRASHGRVQDAYALRCMPQVHGASRDAVAYVRGVLETEIDSVTDNPLVFHDGDVLSGGNFHGQPLALAMDFLAIAVAELASISERRIERLVNPALSAGLPAFLTREGGLNDGFMVAQYTAAALVSENKVLAHPASVDSIPTSANQEDHVSMGAIAARHAREVLENAQTVLAIELLCACQGIELRGRVSGPPVARAFGLLRERVPMLDEDRPLDGDIAKALELVRSGELLAALAD
jgi:histidine ammonia-lyase